GVDDETEDGPVVYPMDGGDDGDDDDGDSSRDDADDEEEEEHLAPADSAVVVPTVKPDSPPEGTESVIPPPSTDITTNGARITVRLQASISLPPEAGVERLLAMPTPSPSDQEEYEDDETEDARITVQLQVSISLPPEAEVERLLAIPTPSPSPPISLSPPSARESLAMIASTQALIDAVTAALPSPPLPPLPPSLYIPPPVDCRDDRLESELPPCKRLHLSTLGPVDSAEAIPEIAHMTLREVNTRVTKLAELHEHDTQDLYALLKDAQEGLSQAVHYKLQTYLKQMQQAEMAAFQDTNSRRQAQMEKTLRVMRDMRREMGDMQAELLALQGQWRRAR
ncbi:hypothetical protein Tco_0604403, partial [Tanacetum coccineum]